MINIDISEEYQTHIQPAWIETAALATLAHQDVEGETDLTVRITGNQELADLNLQFLGIEGPTDVLSFPAGEIDPETGNPYLGDVIISLPKAQEQAEAGGYPLQAEIELLVIHGVLHLLGHDHGEVENKADMWTAQSAILQAINSLNPGPTE